MNETDLDAAERRVRENAARIARQRALITDLKASCRSRILLAQAGRLLTDLMTLQLEFVAFRDNLAASERGI